jgi:hypothetical protein
VGSLPGTFPLADSAFAEVGFLLAAAGLSASGSDFADVFLVDGRFISTKYPAWRVSYCGERK